MGEPSEEQELKYNTLLELHRKTIEEKFKPGVSGGEVYDYFVDQLRNRGIDGEIPILAHGTGAWHQRERPIGEPSETREIAEGMVMVMESSFEDFWHLQDEFLITADGYEWIHLRNRKRIIWL